MLSPLGFDTELVYDSKNGLSVKTQGPYHYARDPRADCYMISVSDGKENWAGHPRDFNFDATKGRLLTSHNKAFDEEVARAKHELGLWPKLEFAEWHCTANMSSFLWNVRSLAEAARIGLGVELSKDVRGKADGKTWDDMVREGWSGDMLKYAAIDPQASVELWNKHSHKWPENERRLSNLTIVQGQRGVAIDIPRLEAGILALQRVIVVSHQNLPWIARGKKPGSPIGMAEECRTAGIPCQPVKTRFPEEHEEWLEKYSLKHPWVAALKNLRKAEKMLATLETIKTRLRTDGRAAFSLLYFGAHTGRWSGAGGWNLQNPNKLPLFIGHDDQFILDLKRILECADLFDRNQPLPDYVKDYVDLRGLIISAEGKILCPADLAQIEPRELNWVVHNQDFLDFCAAGQSPYEAHARVRMGWKGGELKRENKKLYHFAKERVLQLGYGCGWKKFMKRSLLNGIAINEGDTEAALDFSHDKVIHTDKDGVDYVEVLNPYWKPEFGEAGRIKKYTVEGCRSRKEVAQFRTDEKGITELWARLQVELTEAIGGDFVVELPSGRKLTYRDVQMQRRKMKDEETGEEYNRKVLTAVIGNERCVLYGGLLCENLIQAIARDAFAEGMLRLEDAGIPVIFHAHDEAVCEVPPDTDPKRVESILAVTPAWNAGCPLAAEAVLTPRYKK